MTRRNTPQTSQKLGRNMRDRERELEEERWFEEERESFPQFWYVTPALLPSPNKPKPARSDPSVVSRVLLMNCLQYNQLPLPK